MAPRSSASIAPLALAAVVCGFLLATAQPRVHRQHHQHHLASAASGGPAAPLLTLRITANKTIAGKVLDTAAAAAATAATAATSAAVAQTEAPFYAMVGSAPSMVGAVSSMAGVPPTAATLNSTRHAAHSAVPIASCPTGVTMLEGQESMTAATRPDTIATGPELSSATASQMYTRFFSTGALPTNLLLAACVPLLALCLRHVDTGF